jgi:hypothetical protein
MFHWEPPYGSLFWNKEIRSLLIKNNFLLMLPRVEEDLLFVLPNDFKHSGHIWRVVIKIIFSIKLTFSF